VFLELCRRATGNGGERLQTVPAGGDGLLDVSEQASDRTTRKFGCRADGRESTGECDEFLTRQVGGGSDTRELGGDRDDLCFRRDGVRAHLQDGVRESFVVVAHVGEKLGEAAEGRG